MLIVQPARCRLPVSCFREAEVSEQDLFKTAPEIASVSCVLNVGPRCWRPGLRPGSP